MEKQHDMDRQRGRLIDLHLQDRVPLNASLEAVAKGKNGTTKAVRKESSDSSYSADYNKGQDREALVINPKGRKLTKKERESAAVSRILPKLNQAYGAEFEIIPNQQPLDNSSIDVLLTDSHTRGKLETQVRVSDDKPHKDIGTKGQFSRHGDAYGIGKEAIRRAINAKRKKYVSPEDRRHMVFVLDGWPWLTKEHLTQFKIKEHQFMADAGFKEIWFSGYRDETQVRLFP